MNEQVGLQISLVPDGDGVKAMVTGTGRDFDTLSKKGTGAGRKIGREFNKTRAGIQSVSRQLQQTRSQLIAFFSISYAAQQAQQIIGVADAAKTLDARLKLATESSVEYEVASKGLFDIAQRNRTSLETTAGLYAKLAPSMREMGQAQSEVLALTESVSQAIKLSGSSAAAGDAAVQQFTQAMESGVLRGDEFNSINEQGGRLIKALADGLGVARGQLRGLAEDGKLTSRVVVQALSTQRDKLAQEYAQLPLKVSDSMTKIRNEFMVQVAALDQVTGTSATLADGLSWVAENMDLVAASTLLVAANITGRYVPSVAAAVTQQARLLAAEVATEAAKMSSARITVLQTTALLANAKATLAAATGFKHLAATEKLYAAQKQHTIAVEALAAASTLRTAKSVGMLKNAMMLLGGPVGIAVTAATALYFWSASADDSAEKAGTLNTEVDKLNKTMAVGAADGYSRQIKQVNDAIEKAGVALAGYQSNIDKIKAAGAGDKDARIEYFSNQIELEKQKLVKLNTQLKQFAETKKTIEDIASGKSKKGDDKKKPQADAVALYKAQLAERLNAFAASQRSEVQIETQRFLDGQDLLRQSVEYGLATEAERKERMLQLEKDYQKRVADIIDGETETNIEKTKAAALQWSDAWSSAGNRFAAGIGDSTASAILEQENFGDAMNAVAKGALHSVISGLVEIGVKKIAMSALSQALIAKETTTSTAAATTTASAWGPAAAATSVASFGSAAAIGGAALLATFALSKTLFGGKSSAGASASNTASSANQAAYASTPDVRTNNAPQGPTNVTNWYINGSYVEGGFSALAREIRPYSEELERDTF